MFRNEDPLSLDLPVDSWENMPRKSVDSWSSDLLRCLLAVLDEMESAVEWRERRVSRRAVETSWDSSSSSDMLFPNVRKKRKIKIGRNFVYLIALDHIHAEGSFASTSVLKPITARLLFSQKNGQHTRSFFCIVRNLRRMVPPSAN